MWHWRDSTRSHTRFAPVDPAQLETAQGRLRHRLGVVRHVQAESHNLTLSLEAPRRHDAHYSMEIDQIILRPIADGAK